MSMRHVTTPKRFIYASVSVDSTEMGLGVLVSNKFMKCHALFRPDVRESALRDMFSCRIRNPGNFRDPNSVTFSTSSPGLFP